jgi:hypothetical protein
MGVRPHAAGASCSPRQIPRTGGSIMADSDDLSGQLVGTWRLKVLESHMADGIVSVSSSLRCV